MGFRSPTARVRPDTRCTKALKLKRTGFALKVSMPSPHKPEARSDAPTAEGVGGGRFLLSCGWTGEGQRRNERKCDCSRSYDFSYYAGVMQHSAPKAFDQTQLLTGMSRLHQ